MTGSCRCLFKKDYDRNGAAARKGSVLQPVLEQSLNAAYFKLKPPKTAGREEFGSEYAQVFLRRCGRAAKADVIATATALTAASIAQALKSFVLKKGNYRDWVVSGGGTKNAALMEMLRIEAENWDCGCGIQTTSAFPAKPKRLSRLRCWLTRR